MQQTLKAAVVVRGNGLHTGNEVSIKITPAPVNTGIVFVRTDQNPPVHLPATLEYVAFDSPETGGRQTSLQKGNVRIRTVEHLMAVFHGLGIDNAYVEITSDELPGMDGSAKDFMDAVLKVGLIVQDQPRTYYEVKKPVFFENGKQSVVVYPAAEGLKLSYTLSYNHKDLSDQFYSVQVTGESFQKEIAPARTFCLKEEALLLKSMGYGKGANTQNTLVFENNLPIENSLRYDNEACRHKILDLLGDLYLLGKPLRAQVVACRTGHLQNYKLMTKLKDEIKIVKQTGEAIMGQQEGAVETSQQLDVLAIQKIIPHRFPFLLVDRIIEMIPGERAVGLKNVTVNEQFFLGHFPGHPVMPGVLILEALAQVGGVLMLSQPENKGKIAYFMTIENAKFRQPVHPGDQLKLEATVIKVRSRTGQCAGKAYVDGKLVCEAEVKFAIVEP